MENAFVSAKRLFVGATVISVLGFLSALNAEAAGNEPIRVWGHGHRGQDYILTLVKSWQGAYTGTHPEAKFDNELYGDASAMGGLWTGNADIAIIDREPNFTEADGYQQGTGSIPFGIPIARGSVGIAKHAPALIVYVNQANPLTQLRAEQLDGILDADHLLNDRRLRTWGDVGLTGKWRDRPIRIYTFAVQSEQVQFLERAAMKGSRKFSGNLRTKTTAAAIAAAVRADEYGIGILDSLVIGVRAVPIAPLGNPRAVLATRETISAGTYPLAHTIYAYVNRTGNSVPTDVANFLRFVVSSEGQDIVKGTGQYLPLSPEMDAAAREALK